MATRNFKFIGRTYSEDAACTIALNGVEIFSGPLLQESGDELPVCVGSAEVGDDSVDVTLPVVITMTAGSAGIGMFQFNYGRIVNPLLTPEEAAYIGVPKEEIPAEILTSVTNKGGFYVRSADQYVYGLNPEQTNDNRSNIQLNGSPVSDPDWYYQLVTTGQVLTFDQLIFARS